MTAANRIINKQGNTTKDTKEIQNIVKECFKKDCNSLSWKCKRNAQISRFIQTTKVKSRRNQQCKQSMANKEIEMAIESLPTKKRPRPNVLITNIYSDFRQFMDNPSEVIQRNRNRRSTPKFFLQSQYYSHTQAK